MELAAYRKTKGLTQSAVADALGLRSKGYISAIERGHFRCPVPLALKIQKWSGGNVTARELVSADDAELLDSVQ